MGKTPRDMTEAEFVQEFDELRKRTRRVERRVEREHGPASAIAPPRARADGLKDWEAYSRSRGFTEEEIVDFRRWLELNGDGKGFDYTLTNPRWFWLQHLKGPLDPWESPEAASCWGPPKPED